MNDNFENNFFGNVIYAYTRQQAINDGVLVDVTETKEAKEAGIKYPIAVTRAVWDAYIEWTEKDSDRQTYQDQTGRLWDVLWMFRLNARSCEDDCFLYTFFVVPRGGRGTKARQKQLKAVIGCGDNCEPVITIMMPDED